MVETPPTGLNNPQKFNNGYVKEDIFNTMNNMNKTTEKIYKFVNTLVKIYNERNSNKITESQIKQIVEDLSKFDTETIMDSLILKIMNRIDT
jgi:hypothetical protein